MDLNDLLNAGISDVLNPNGNGDVEIPGSGGGNSQLGERKPGVIETYSTIVLPNGRTATIDQYGNIISVD